MQTQPATLDCRGLRCPAPILKLSRAARGDEAPDRLKILADDGDFPTDLRAWCRSTGATLESLSEADGFFVADVALQSSTTSKSTSQAEQRQSPPRVPVTEVDCAGMRCPAPILAISRASKQHTGPAMLRVTATDGDFPTDIEAWCRSTGHNLLSMDTAGVSIQCVIGLNGLEAVPTESQAPSEAAAPGHPQPSGPLRSSATSDEDQADTLDLTSEPHGMVLARVAQHAMDNDQFEFTVASDPSLQVQLQSWSAAMGWSLAFSDERLRTRGILTKSSPSTIPPTPLPANAEQVYAHTATQPSALPREVAAEDGVPRKNKATLLVLHNDFEPLMAAMMVANASAAQGMEVEVYFSFWGVNFLRGPSSRPPETAIAKFSPLKRMMKMMMPAGPDRQQMSKMNFAGAGVGMMKYFMRQDNIMSLRELMEQAVELDVKFMVCTMSMGLMGISKADLMDLPNIEFAGVTAFSGSARESATSMVF